MARIALRITRVDALGGVGCGTRGAANILDIVVTIPSVAAIREVEREGGSLRVIALLHLFTGREGTIIGSDGTTTISMCSAGLACISYTY